MKKEYLLNIIKTIRESFGASIAVYTCGNCYQFYEILKAIFPEAQAVYDGNHIWTKIDNCFYDIRGECFNVSIEKPIIIENLSRNKWTDDRRTEYSRVQKKLHKPV